MRQHNIEWMGCAGMRVETRPIHWDEMQHLDEAGACGTAVVITPLSQVTSLYNYIEPHTVIL